MAPSDLPAQSLTTTTLPTPHIEDDDSPETNLDTHEDSEKIEFRTLMNLVAERRTMEDSELLESLAPLATSGRIPETIVHGLNILNTRLEDPI
ncbi:hypothetical protein FS749_012269, partial [Ceratobasidium sp. UAMH 11750]